MMAGKVEHLNIDMRECVGTVCRHAVVCVCVCARLRACVRVCVSVTFISTFLFFYLY